MHLVTETLKIVIAVICIGFLVYLLVMMYFSGAEEKERQDAESLIDRMKGISAELEEGNSSEVNGLTPADWGIFSYAGAEKRPNQCAGTSCICICDDVIDAFNRQLKECNDNGICFAAKDLLQNPEIIIKDGGETDIEIYREGGRLGVREI